MVIFKSSVTQPTTGAWAASGVISTDLQRVGLLTRIDATVEITPSATLTGANQPDAMRKVVGNLRVIGSRQTYFTLPGDVLGQAGVLLSYVNKYDGHGIGHSDGAILAPVHTYQPMNFVLHCGGRPRDMYGRDNPFDITAFIPAETDGQLVAEWNTTANTVMDDTVTISSAVIRYTLHRILGTEQEMSEEIQRQGVVLPPGLDGNYDPTIRGMVPVWSAVNHANVGATTDYDAEQLDVPGNSWLKRIDILAQDATATRVLRAGDEANRFALIIPGSSQRVFEINGDALMCHLEYGTGLTINSGASEAGLTEKMGVDFNASAPQGVFIKDLRPYTITPSGKDYGLDLRGYGNTDVKLGLYIQVFAAGDDTLVIYERYQAHRDRLANVG